MDSFGAASSLEVGETRYDIFRIDKVPGSGDLPFCHKVLLENLLRTEDGANVTADHIGALGSWDPAAEPSQEIQFSPARVIMQDFTGVPCVGLWNFCWVFISCLLKGASGTLANRDVAVDRLTGEADPAAAEGGRGPPAHFVMLPAAGL